MSEDSPMSPRLDESGDRRTAHLGSIDSQHKTCRREAPMFGPRLSRARLAAFVVVSALAVPGGVISAAGDTAHQPCERERHSCGTLIIAGPVGPSTLPEGVARNR